jgi:hypothetical protein
MLESSSYGVKCNAYGVGEQQLLLWCFVGESPLWFSRVMIMALNSKDYGVSE